MLRWRQMALIILTLGLSPTVWAALPSLQAISMQTASDGTQTYSISLQILFIMTILSLLPGLLMMTTSFTRIIIVLSILRQALGLQSTPTNQILISIALFLTFFIMAPVFNQAYTTAVDPYLKEKISADQAIKFLKQPFQQFMLSQTRKSDLELFSRLADEKAFQKNDDVPLTLLMPAFITSELKTGFQIGFLLFLPFLIIDIVVASVLMSMGMMMLSPLIISLPFKIMLFVLVDGWVMILGTLASSFGVAG